MSIGKNVSSKSVSINWTPTVQPDKKLQPPSKENQLNLNSDFDFAEYANNNNNNNNNNINIDEYNNNNVNSDRVYDQLKDNSISPFNANTLADKIPKNAQPSVFTPPKDSYDKFAKLANDYKKQIFKPGQAKFIIGAFNKRLNEGNIEEFFNYIDENKQIKTGYSKYFIKAMALEALGGPNLKSMAKAWRKFPKKRIAIINKAKGDLFSTPPSSQNVSVDTANKTPKKSQPSSLRTPKQSLNEFSNLVKGYEKSSSVFERGQGKYIIKAFQNRLKKGNVRDFFNYVDNNDQIKSGYSKYFIKAMALDALGGKSLDAMSSAWKNFSPEEKKKEMDGSVDFFSVTNCP